MLPAETQRALLERAGGNPLYAEEFVRLLATAESRTTRSRRCRSSVQALIAARLDTLPPERKSLLQDAAVLGKVFWAGALAEMGERRPGEVELALHELSRKELVRPARTSSMEGEREYGFWHVLVRDVCYGQIPRAARAARHRAAAAWIERKAGERVEDLADVLAYHYLHALELTRAVGDERRDERAARHGRLRYLGPGRRARALRSTSTVPRRHSPVRSSSPRPATPSALRCSSAGRRQSISRAACRRRGRRSRRRSPSTAAGASPSPPGAS